MVLLQLAGLKQPIDPRTIICVIGENNYTWLHCTQQRKHLVAITLCRVEEQLTGFVRIHKSGSVNARHIAEIDNMAQQLMNIELNNGMVLAVARRRIRTVRQQLNQLSIPMLKPSVHNITTWWFAADTPIRHYKLSLNPTLRWACEQISRQFVPPSGAATLDVYKRADKIAFAKSVEKLIEFTAKPLTESLSQN